MSLCSVPLICKFVLRARRVKAMGGAHTEMNFEAKADITIDGIVEHCLRYLVIDGGAYNKAQMMEVIEHQMEKQEGGKIGTATELGMDPADDFMSILEQVSSDLLPYFWFDRRGRSLLSFCCSWRRFHLAINR